MKTCIMTASAVLAAVIVAFIPTAIASPMSEQAAPASVKDYMPGPRFEDAFNRRTSMRPVAPAPSNDPVGTPDCSSEEEDLASAITRRNSALSSKQRLLGSIAEKSETCQALSEELNASIASGVHSQEIKDQLTECLADLDQLTVSEVSVRRTLTLARETVEAKQQLLDACLAGRR